MQFKNLETTWAKISNAILANTISGEHSKVIGQVVDKKMFGCQSEVLANIFQVILGNKNVDKENGLVLLTNSDFTTEKILFLGCDNDGDKMWMDLEDGEIQNLDGDDLDASSPVSLEKATSLLGEIENYQLLQILSFYLKNQESMDKALQQKPSQNKLTAKEQKDQLQEILEDCDSMFETFYGKISEHLLNLMKLKSVPEPKKVVSKKVPAIDLDGIVDHNFNALSRKDKRVKLNAGDVKRNLWNIFSLTLENQPVNPFSGYNSDVVEIVRLFLTFSSVSDTIESFQEKGLQFLSSIHPNFKQIFELYKSVKTESLQRLQVVKPKFLWDGDNDDSCENACFFYDAGDEVLRNENTWVNGNFRLDRLFLEYPTVKEVAKFINSQDFDVEYLF